MKLSECTYGIIVTNGEKVGMIVGITNNCPDSDIHTRNDKGRAIPLVQWANGSSCGVHHTNLRRYMA